MVITNKLSLMLYEQSFFKVNHLIVSLNPRSVMGCEFPAGKSDVLHERRPPCTLTFHCARKKLCTYVGTGSCKTKQAGINNISA